MSHISTTIAILKFDFSFLNCRSNSLRWSFVPNKSYISLGSSCPLVANIRSLSIKASKAAGVACGTLFCATDRKQAYQKGTPGKIALSVGSGWRECRMAGRVWVMDYLVVKTLHIVLVISWFAGLFYLPRIFVNLAMVPPDSRAEYDRLLLMAGKLYRFMTPIGYLSIALGLWLWLGFDQSGGWLHVKTLLVVGLVAYNRFCRKL